MQECLTRENIESYQHWCNGIIVNDSLVFKDYQGVLRTARFGDVIAKRNTDGKFQKMKLKYD